MASPFLSLVAELRQLSGQPKATYPAGDADYPVSERVLRLKRGQHLPTFFQADPDSGRFPNNVLVDHVEVGGDVQMVEVYRRWERLPGADVPETATEPDTGIVINKVTTKVRSGTRGGVDYPSATNISGATVAAQTVLTVASTAGLRKGLQVTIAGNSNCTPDIDGRHFIVAVGTGTVTIDFQVTAVTSGGTGGTLQLSAEVHREIVAAEGGTAVQISSQVNTASLATAGYAVDTQIDHQLADLLLDLIPENETADSTSTADGTFPIPTNITIATQFSSSSGVAPLLADGAAGKFAAVVATSYSYGQPDITPPAVSISAIAPITLAISSISAAADAVVTVPSTAALIDGGYYLFSGTDSSPNINGLHKVTILDGTTFRISKNTGVAGTTGTVAIGTLVTVSSTAILVSGRYYVFAGTDSTPRLDGQHPITILSGTTFSVPLQTTAGGSAGTVTADVLRVRLATGAVLCRGAMTRESTAYSIQTAGIGTETVRGVSQSVREVMIPHCLSGVWGTDDGTELDGRVSSALEIKGGVTMYLRSSSPTHFVAGATFLLSDEVVKQRLGIYERRRVTLTVPAT